ncbi:MAG TPA: DUF6169 family protein [Mucilaginibacter sp.]|nr:DUF6169 family protein [Mucilaginibacter sp.]
MSPLYNFDKNQDGSYHFISDSGSNYLIYFLESTIPDSENNIHTIYNLGFTRDGEHACKSFFNKYDGKIRATIMFIINDVFKKNEHRTLVYFCFGDDGYSRHRNIVFKRWAKDLDISIEAHNGIIDYDNNLVYSSLIIVSDNPLKKLILESFDTYLQELKQHKIS